MSEAPGAIAKGLSGDILAVASGLYRFQIKDEIKAARIEATRAYR